jgi:POT family proton-dependent oligopeptide transporter
MQKEKHPPGLAVLFLSEMWERFGFYTMGNLFVLYLTHPNGFNRSKDFATDLNSYYLMFVYASPLVGGWIADRGLGYRRSVILGGLIFMIGYLLFMFPSMEMLYVALACLVVGNGFFKPNVSAMVGHLYREGSPLKDHAYNIFYMGINIGAFFAPIVGEYMQGKYGFRSAFIIAAAGMVFPVVLLTVYKRYVEVHDGRPEQNGAEDSDPRGAEEAAAPSPPPPPSPMESVPEWKRIAALIVIFLIVIVFWMVFHQNTVTFVYWANENTDWTWVNNLIGQEMSGVIAGAINPFWVVTLTFPLVAFWQWLGRRGLEPSTPTKIAIGMLLTAGSFFFLAYGALLGEATAAADTPYAFKVSPWWLVGTYFIITLGELMLSPMGLSLVSKVAPVRMRGLMMGGWFLATAIGNKLTAIGKLWEVWLHSTFFAFLGVLALVTAVVLFVLLKPLKKAMPGV